MNPSDFLEIQKEFNEILLQFQDSSTNNLDLFIDNVFLSLTKNNISDSSKSDIKYILLIKNGTTLKIHKNTNQTLDVLKERKTIDFLFLKTRFNRLSPGKRSLFYLLAEQFSIWTKTEKDLVTFFLSHYCETPERVYNFFETLKEYKCHTCNKLCNEIRKCVHFDCKGICLNCYSDVEQICSSCQQKQEILCPICREFWTIKSCRMLNCGHGICWKCISLSWKTVGKDINKCPQCRVPT